MNAQFGLILTLLTLSCSSSVELTRMPGLRPSKDPTVLASIDEQVGTIAVDEQRLYWTGYSGVPGAETSALRSCKKRDCVNSLVTYDPANVSYLTSFGVVAGQVYWLHLVSSDPRVLVLRGCDMAGCGNVPRTVARDIYDWPSTVAFNADTMFFSNGGIFSVPLAGDSVTPTLVRSTPHDCFVLAAHGDYLYWITQGTEYGRGAQLQRAHADGSGDIETLASGLELNFSYSPFSQTAFAVDETYVYWSQGTLHGSIARCPLAGCSGPPEIVVDPVRSPTTLAIDGQRLYWQHDTAMQGLAVSGCTLGNCARTTPIAVGLEAANALAIDDQYLYTATTDQQIPAGGWTDPSAEIRRIHK